jgi:hypothetical protein
VIKVVSIVGILYCRMIQMSKEIDFEEAYFLNVHSD